MGMSDVEMEADMAGVSSTGTSEHLRSGTCNTDRPILGETSYSQSLLLSNMKNGHAIDGCPPHPEIHSQIAYPLILPKAHVLSTT